jgi:hypothetical protein
MDLTVLEIVYRLIAGVGIGFVIGLTGVGGGVLVMPALTILFKFETTMAVGTASMYACLTKIYAGFEHFRLKNIDFSVSNLFLFGAIPGNIVTIFAILWYKQVAEPNAVTTFQSNLKVFIAVIMLISAAMMIYNLLQKKKAKSNDVADSAEKKHNILLGVTCGLIIGSLIGATSVGGGVLVVPMLVIFFGLTTNRTVGSSIYIALVLVGVSTILYSFGPSLVANFCEGTAKVAAGKQVEYATAIIMAVGSLLGVFFGSRLSVKMPEKPLTIFVIILILVSAVAMLAK